ncbi:neutral zinc metallopeptidase [Jidongwangia harbinensis]|uniref:neutral zinc metallopeptidase n=1 Tax=Jidongwangia harbinensis TaxID=2878561 RepID=UPI001CD9C162|nr:neutral zinc metallopeptidase [Jidongwangia harbinensis]MCA2219144.1 neutral zinc metallopeptidase [Jidongwangia harbinensis]
MPALRRPRLTILAPVAAALIALGCVAAPRDNGAPVDAGAPAPQRTGSSGSDPDGTDTPEEFAGDVADAREIAEEYWAARFRSSGLDFRPVARLIPYEREGEVECGGQPLGRNNAAYCSAGDFIAYDVNWAYAAFRQIGDAFIFYLLGHEYAHAVQLRLGIRKQFTIQQELQADCMAGAYIGDMERDGRLDLQEADTEELARGLEAVGDEPGQPWFAEGAHGTARQRTRAFRNGYQESLEPCNLS